MENKLINELTNYVKDLKSNYELRLAQEWQKGYNEGWKQAIAKQIEEAWKEGEEND